MEFNKRVQDLSLVFDRNWNVNKNNQQRVDFLNHRKEHLKKMYDVKEEVGHTQEILNLNSVNGQVKNLNDRMQAMNNSQRIARMNDFKRNFK